MGEDDVYGWWLLGCNMVEHGLSQVLFGVKLERKAIQLMAQMHDKKKKMETETETDTG